MKETVSIEMWMKALNRFLLKNGSSMEQMRWKSQQPVPANNRGAFNNTAVNSGLINLVRGEDGTILRQLARYHVQ
jgi:hypothetical protein